MKRLSLGISAVALLIAMAGAGCAEHRYYDSSHHDYHRWSPDEDRYYREWYLRAYPKREFREYKHLDKQEQERYWHERHGER